MKRISLIVMAATSLAGLSGCTSLLGASSAITNDKLVERTAFALGVEERDITILDRRDEGMMARYRARTSAGKIYNCSISGGRLPEKFVSDARCTGPGKEASNPLTGQ